MRARVRALWPSIVAPRADTCLELMLPVSAKRLLVVKVATSAKHWVCVQNINCTSWCGSGGDSSGGDSSGGGSSGGRSAAHSMRRRVW